MGHGVTIEDCRHWSLVPGHVMMWGNSDQHVFTNDKGRGKLLRGLGSVASYFCAEIHAYLLWHDDAWHAAPDTTNTLEEYWHNGQDM